MNQKEKRIDLHFVAPKGKFNYLHYFPYLLDCNNFMKAMMENIENFRDNVRSCNSALLQIQPFQISGIYTQSLFLMCMDMYSYMMDSHIL